jgi:hypothetical protein
MYSVLVPSCASHSRRAQAISRWRYLSHRVLDICKAVPDAVCRTWNPLLIETVGSRHSPITPIALREESRERVTIGLNPSAESLVLCSMNFVKMIEG